MFSYILPFLFLILVVVFIHEYGHYYFAKKYGVMVTDFSIGFVRFNKFGEVEYIFVNPIFRKKGIAKK